MRRLRLAGIRRLRLVGIRRLRLAGIRRLRLAGIRRLRLAGIRRLRLAGISCCWPVSSCVSFLILTAQPQSHSVMGLGVANIYSRAAAGEVLR